MDQKGERSTEVTLDTAIRAILLGGERGITVTLATLLFVPFHPETIAGRLVRLCNPRTLRT
jgi:hypothetical protein